MFKASSITPKMTNIELVDKLKRKKFDRKKLLCKSITIFYFDAI